MARFGKLLPFVAFLAFVIITGNTNWLTQTLHDQMVMTLKHNRVMLLPMILDFSIAALVVYGAFISYKTLESIFTRSLGAVAPTMSEKGRNLSGLIFQTAFWMFIIFVAARIVAPKFIDSMLLGGGILAGSLAFIWKDTLQNFALSWCLHVKPRCSVGDYIKIVEKSDAQGVVLKIDYLHIKLQLDDGREITVPNSIVWTATIIHGKDKARVAVGDYIKLGDKGDVQGVVKEIDAIRTYVELDDGRIVSVPNSTVTSSTITFGKKVETDEADDKAADGEAAAEPAGCCACCPCVAAKALEGADAAGSEASPPNPGCAECNCARPSDTAGDTAAETSVAPVSRCCDRCACKKVADAGETAGVVTTVSSPCST